MSQVSIGAGLTNLGNTCFFNAALQTILHTEPLMKHFQHHQHSNHCTSKINKQWCVFCELENIYLQTRNLKVYAPNTMIRNLKTIFKKFKLGRQEDSHEFLRYLIEGMQESQTGKLGKDREENQCKLKNTKTFNIFGGIIKTSVQCLSCNQKSITTERYYDFNIECQRSNTLEEGLAGFFAVDSLDGSNKYNCDMCKTRSNAKKRFYLETIPPVMTFQFKRFTNLMRKIGKFMKYPHTFNAGKFLQHPRNVTMKLYGIIVHAGGSSYSGHYYSYVRVGQNWYRMDDSYVTKCNMETIMGQNAYILLYQKIAEDNIKMPTNIHPIQTHHDKQSVKITPQNPERIYLTSFKDNNLPKQINQKQKIQENINKNLFGKKQDQNILNETVHENQKPQGEIQQQNNEQIIQNNEDDQNLQDLCMNLKLVRSQSKEDREKNMSLIQIVGHYIRKNFLLQSKLPLRKPRNSSMRQVYNLRKYEMPMEKKRKLI